MTEMSERTQRMRWRRLLFEKGVSEETLDEIRRLSVTVPEVHAMVSILDHAHELSLESVFQIFVALAGEKERLIKLAEELSSGRAISHVVVLGEPNAR